MIGETLGHYRIVEKLGGGGMGDVYLAEDAQLGRKVALKVLRPELAASPERRQRFEKEARALAALSHPGIVTVFSVEQVKGVDFLTMELVRGKPLSRLVPKGGLPLSELFALAIPLADAVAAAHAHGITHRDLKPDNVMVDDEGRVKVLDFGLAKLKQELLGGVDSRFSTETGTAEGRILGTVAYMSPEQAEGRPVDPRSDVFSLGVVLYEMATGQRPFQGGTASALLASVIKDTPALVTELRPELPRDLGRLLRRALQKDPEERIQTAKELRNELRELKAEVDSGEAWEKPVKPSPSGWTRKALVGGALLALAVGLGVWRFVGRAPSLGPMTVTPITSDLAYEAEPALSPDGKLVAFLREGEGEDLYVKQIAGGEALRVAQKVWLGNLAWSPGSGHIAFYRHVEREEGGVVDVILAVPALGGRERRLATAFEAREDGAADFPHGLAWSPDGTQLAIMDVESPQDVPGIFLVHLESGEKRRLTRTSPVAERGDSRPRFSPDGRTVAFVRGGWPKSEIHLVPTAGGEPRQLTFGNWWTQGLDWTADGKSLVFSSLRGARGSLKNLWRVAASGGEPQPLEVGQDGASPTLSRSGRRLVYARETGEESIWRVGGPTASLDEQRRPHRFIASTRLDWSPAYSPDGKHVLFSSNRSGHGEVWIADADGTHPRQLTFFQDVIAGAARGWSPDGQRIAVMSGKQGSFDIYVVDAGGGPPRPLAVSPANEDNPSWSRDGRWVYLSSGRSGQDEVWKIPASGGEAVQVTRNGGCCGVEWNGDLYFVKSNMGGGAPGLWRLPAGGQDEERILDSVAFINWAVFEKGICYINRDAEPQPRIEFYDFATGEVSTVAALDHRPSLSGMSVSPDGRWVLYVVSTFQSDIMLVETFQ